ncbi:hypothetical protein V6N12_062961 [Hibiscus sabdariffa]|uniref:Uncharacterized protein n=1 Tax=Hibiscus sabdariffa TaxID=183260 RepID=A0ABR2FAD8_9ROSI
MKIVCNDEKFVTHLENVVEVDTERPMLIGKYLIVAIEIDIDALVDLGNIAIGGIIDTFMQSDEVEERKRDLAIDVTVSALTEEKGVIVVSKKGIGNYRA